MQALVKLVALAAALATAAPSLAQEFSLAAQLEAARSKYGLPALAAAVVKDGKIVASAAVGTRILGQNIPVTVDDKFHIGSDTKAMTATLAAMMIEDGKLRWNSTVGEVLGPSIPGLTPGFAAITLEQLLTHTSGIPSDTDEIGALYFSPDAFQATLPQSRRRMISAWGSKHEPSFPVATKFQYANLGYITAGAMIEQAAGQSWDELIVKRIFEPLGLKTAGLGPQATFGHLDAPVGHAVDDDGTITPRPWGPGADNPTTIGPAGIAHMSVVDFATWAGWNAAEGKRGPAIVKPETLKRLHEQRVEMAIENPKPGTPKSGGYGFGWGMIKFDWAAVPLLTHNGSNAMNLATILVDPVNDIGITVATNFPGENADQALLEQVEALYRRFGPEGK